MTETTKKVKGKLFKELIQRNDDLGFGLRTVWFKSREKFIHPNVYPIKLPIQRVEVTVDSAEALSNLTIRKDEKQAIYDILRDTVSWAEEQAESMAEEPKTKGKVKDSKLNVLEMLAKPRLSPADEDLKEQ